MLKLVGEKQVLELSAFESFPAAVPAIAATPPQSHNTNLQRGIRFNPAARELLIIAGSFLKSNYKKSLNE